MTATELISMIKNAEKREGKRPDGVTMHAIDVIRVQLGLMDQSVAAEAITTDVAVRKIPQGAAGETYVMTFLGVPVFKRDGAYFGPYSWTHGGESAERLMTDVMENP